MEDSFENCDLCRNKAHTRAQHRAMYRKEYSREYSYWSRRIKANNRDKNYKHPFIPRNPFTGDVVEHSFFTMPKQIEEFKLSLVSSTQN